MPDVQLKVFRGTATTAGEMVDYDVPVEEGMVVLDALHWIQAHEAPDLAVRWNCKAAKCGSCGAEVNGRPRLTCKTRLSDFPDGEPITVEPMRAFPLDQGPRHRRLVELRGQSPHPAVHSHRPTARRRPGAGSRQDIERVQEFRKCIECFLCQDVCHVLRNHETERPFIGPRFLVREAGLEMHPMDTADRTKHLKDDGGIGLCNITKCCTEVCPEHIKITDNAIIPLKERVADRYYDPIQIAWRKLRGALGRRREASPGRSGHETASGATTDDPTAGPLGQAAVHHPHGRGRARQPGASLAGGRADRRHSIRRPRPCGPARRDDLGVPRGADEQRRRVHRGRPGARAGPPLAGRRGGPVARFEAHRGAARWSVAGQGCEAPATPRRGATAPRRVPPAGRRRTCRERRTRWPMRWRTPRSIG